ncbi:hypothetical protein [Sphingobacterium deserti]|uniref:Uncharacterized protein n=1 Tax=Sphingobacterium deserti TaxID=1229276 RepID=A0A0B8T5W6_9SPHI|nr:hypothetical protein [Sphingobacterium deserti]KGE16168.1 hypothetical protein DI53_0001 [Sphingobacterium deserti]
MRTLFLLCAGFLTTCSIAQERKDFYVTPSQDTVWGELIGPSIMAMKFQRASDGEKITLREKDFILAKSYKTNKTYIATFFDDDEKRKHPTVFVSRSKGPIYLIKRRRMGAAPGGYPGVGVGVTIGGNDVYLYKEENGCVVYINTAATLGSKHSDSLYQLKAMMGDDPHTVQSIDALIGQKMSLKTLTEIVDTYNAGKP